jgi:hypothetical protein
VIGMEMLEKHRLRVNPPARQLRLQIFTRFLPGIIAVRRMFREGVVEASVDQEVSETGMAHPMNQHGEIARGAISNR